VASLGTFDVGDTVRLGNWSGNSATAAFTNVSGVATDPATVTLTVQKPDLTEVTYTWNGSPALTRESAGRFYADVAIDHWFGELVGTGAVATRQQFRFRVRQPYF
jgi:hypothetical protein